MRLQVINIIGPKKAGKDTAADALKKSKLARMNVSFAAPLKKVCMEHFDLSRNHVHDQDIKEIDYLKRLSLI